MTNVQPHRRRHAWIDNDVQPYRRRCGWTDEDLANALDNVWNHSMTIAQASTAYGIPYSSLYKYVRGQTGKHMHFEWLQNKKNGRQHHQEPCEKEEDSQPLPLELYRSTNILFPSNVHYLL